MAELSDISPPSSNPAPARDRFIGHANLMSFITVISRVFGLVRDKLWSSYLGLGPEFAAFWMGFQLPNLFRRIFGEGALTAVFVPVYTRIRNEHGQDAANRLVACTATLLVTFLGGLTLIGEMILLPFALSTRVQPPNALAALMLALMLPYCVLVCLVAFFSAVASVHERFTAQSISPIILNVVTAAAALLPVLIFGRDYPLGERIVWVAMAVLIAGVLQVLQMLPTLHRSGVKLGVLLDFRTSGISDVMSAMAPMILGLSAVQFNTFMDGQIAWWLSPDGHNKADHFFVFGHLIHVPMGAGALSKLSVAQRLYMLPVGIFGVSMATAIFPLLSKAAAAADIREVKRLLIAGLRKTLFLSLPASAGMILIAEPLITLIYSGRATQLEDIHRAAWATVWFCAGIWAFEAQLVILRVFYAMRDTRTPMKIAVAMVLLNFALNLTLVWFMQEGGLALSTTLSAIIQSAILMLILRRRYGRLGLKQLRTSLIKGAVGCAVMVAAAWSAGQAVGVIRLTNPDPKMEKLLRALVDLPVILVVAVGVYVAMAWLLKMPELADMPVVGRLWRHKPDSAAAH